MLKCQDIVASKRATFVLLRFVRFVLLLSFISRHFYSSPNCPASYVFDCVSSNLFMCFRKFSSFKLKFLTRLLFFCLQGNHFRKFEAVPWEMRTNNFVLLNTKLQIQNLNSNKKLNNKISGLSSLCQLIKSI
jgi:hypothetical protein